MDDQQLIRFIDNRIPGRQAIIDLQAVGILLDDPQILALADDLAAIRQAIRGGSLQPGNRHWPASWD